MSQITANRLDDRRIDSVNTSPDTAEIAQFYDGFQLRLLRDYVYGNARVAGAIDRVCAWIDPECTTVLDVGCGIGTSSAAYANERPWVRVHGVDISPTNIETARRLFRTSRVSFDVSAMDAVPAGAPFDVVALIDVYEHVPRADWPALHSILSCCLSESGRLVLTTPTPLHQEYLARHNPQALQIVDETVQLDDIIKLQQDVRGTLVCSEYMSIWNTNDYFHVVIERSPKYGTLPVPVTRRGAVVRRLKARLGWREVIGVRNRRHHLKASLGIEL
jgi:2-polyprenyl-3-methyl-5-hydroxy-6-metoxy-1,4-benzoquinol methylase